MVKKALLIGINYIGTESQLNGCINDINNIKNYIQTDLGYKNEEITVLSEEPNHVKPTRENIIKYMKLLVENNTADSHLFLHYSGHGSNIRDTNGDERDSQDECIVPLNFNDYDGEDGFLSDDEIKKILIEPLVEGASLVGIFDSCFSGTICDIRNVFSVDSNKNNHNYKIEVDEHYPPTKGNVVILSGCMDNQTSLDAYEENKSQGAMSYSFLKTITHFKQTHETLTYGELIKYLTVFMKEKGYSQIPKMSTGKMVNFNDKFQV